MIKALKPKGFISKSAKRANEITINAFACYKK